MSAFTIAGAVLSLVTLGLVLWTGRRMGKLRDRCRKDLETARAFREEGERMVYWAEQAKLILHREDPDGPIQPHLSVVIDHKEDPVLRPYELLVVRLPDPDWEEVHDLGRRDFATAVPSSGEALQRLAEADYAIAVNDSGVVRVIKWRERSEEQMEARFYGAS